MSGDLMAVDDVFEPVIDNDGCVTLPGGGSLGGRHHVSRLDVTTRDMALRFAREWLGVVKLCVRLDLEGAEAAALKAAEDRQAKAATKVEGLAEKMFRAAGGVEWSARSGPANEAMKESWRIAARVAIEELDS